MSVTEQIDSVFRVTADRGADYGHPYDDFERAAALEDVVAACPDPRLRHVLYMIATKMARLVHTPDHVDSWVDIAGYARTAGMVLDAEADKKETRDG